MERPLPSRASCSSTPRVPASSVPRCDHRKDPSLLRLLWKHLSLATAEGVFKKLVADAGLAHAFHVESAGIGNWHVGERPDPRTIRAAEARGYRLESRAQHWQARDFDRFDYVVGMDRTHVLSLVRLAKAEPRKAKISLARDHVIDGPRDADVPDPYYEVARGFRRGRRYLP